MQKVFDQKEVISNRLEFLDNEKLAVLAEVKKSSVRDEIVERKKSKVKSQVQETLFKKQDENLGVTKRQNFYFQTKLKLRIDSFLL